MRTTLSIEDGLLEEAKKRARKQKITVGEVVNEALRVGLLGMSKRSSATVSAPLKTFRGDGVRPGIDLRHSSELLEEMERA
jgi:hypothetical protein